MFITQLNGFIQGDKRVYTRRQTCLPYTLHLICTVATCKMYMYMYMYTGTCLCCIHVYYVHIL